MALTYIYTLLLLSLIGSASLAFKDKEDWKANYDKILNEASEEIVDPEGVQQLMERLLETIPADIQSYNELKYTLEFGLEFSRISESKCIPKEIYRYTDNLYFTNLNRKTLIPYLNFYRTKQVEACGPVLAKKVSEAVSRIKPRDAEDAKSLAAALMSKFNVYERKVPREILIEVALAYMRAKKSIPFYILKFTQAQRAKALSKFIDAYESTFKFCQQISDQFYESMQLYKAMKRHDSWNMDSDTEHWIMVVRICRTFDPDIAQFKTETFMASMK